MASESDLQRAKAKVKDLHEALGLEEGQDSARVRQALEDHYSPEVKYRAPLKACS